VKQYKKRVSLYPGISASTVGAIGELRAAADLLAKGYEVFVAGSPGASCDLVTLRDGVCLRIEVRTAYYTADGGVSYAIHPRDRGRQDHYAAILPDRIVYVPELAQN
jgi:Holliday junction resolvase-like predicted endonuclease